MLDAQTEQTLQTLATRFPSVFSEVKSAIQSGSSLNPEQQRLDFQKYQQIAYGEHNPDLLCSQWADSAPNQEHHIYLTTGIGNGRHILNLLEKVPTTSRVVAVETDAGRIFNAIQYSSSIDTLINDPRFILLGLFNYRQGINELNQELVGIDSASIHLFAPLYELDPQLYSRVLNIILTQLSTRWNQIRTDVENAASLFENTLSNLIKVGINHDINRFSQSFDGGCLALVAAGPSLDKNLALLQTLQGKALIAVVNSAYPTIKAHNIHADITVAVDPKPATEDGYSNTETTDTLLIAPYVVYPGVTDHFSARTIGLSSHNPFMSVLRKVLGFKEEPNIVGDGTVSITVANLAALFGCKTVLLIGQDLALASTGQTHSGLSHYAKSHSNQKDTRLLDWVENNQGNRVPIEQKLKAYLKTFEEVIAHYPQIRFYNLSEEGAKIKGAPLIDSDQALKFASESISYAYHEVINEKLSQSLPADKVNYGIYLFMEKFEQFLRDSIEDLLKLVISKKNDLENVRNRLQKRFDDHPTFASLGMEGETKKRYYEVIQKTGNWKLITDQDIPVEAISDQAEALLDGYCYQLKHIIAWIKAYQLSSQN